MNRHTVEDNMLIVKFLIVVFTVLYFVVASGYKFDLGMSKENNKPLTRGEIKDIEFAYYFKYADDNPKNVKLINKYNQCNIDMGLEKQSVIEGCAKHVASNEDEIKIIEEFKNNKLDFIKYKEYEKMKNN